MENALSSFAGGRQYDRHALRVVCQRVLQRQIYLPILPSAATDAKRQKQGSYLQGKAEGREEGRVEGREEERLLADAEKLESARAMLAEGDSKEKVCRVLELSEAQIKAL